MRPTSLTFVAVAPRVAAAALLLAGLLVVAPNPARAEGGYVATAPHELDGAGELLLSGDVDGDGLDALVAGVELGTSIALQVMLQCARDQAADCAEWVPSL